MATSVAIVDDDARLASSLARELRARDYEVLVATSGEDALQQLEDRGVDVLVTDLRLSGMDGMAILRQVRKKWPKTRAILISAYATAQDYKQAIALGAVDVVTKPFTADTLIAAIQRAFDCDQGFHGNLHGIALTDLLQMLHYSKRSITVRIGHASAIYMRDGEIVHAQHGDKVGEEALVRLLSKPSGMVQTAALTSDVQTIDAPLEALLLDSARQIDEEDPREPSVVDDFDMDEAFPEVADRSAAEPEPGDSADRRESAVPAPIQPFSHDAVTPAAAPPIAQPGNGAYQPFTPGEHDPRSYSAPGTPFDIPLHPVQQGRRRALMVVAVVATVLTLGLVGLLGVLQNRQPTPPAGPIVATDGDRRVTMVVSTNPPGLELVNAASGLSLGTSPATVIVTSRDFPLRLMARHRGQLSEVLFIAEELPDTPIERIRLDLRDWTATLGSQPSDEQPSRAAAANAAPAKGSAARTNLAATKTTRHRRVARYRRIARAGHDARRRSPGDRSEAGQTATAGDTTEAPEQSGTPSETEPPPKPNERRPAINAIEDDTPGIGVLED